MAPAAFFRSGRLLVPPDGEHESVITQTEISDRRCARALYLQPDEHVCATGVLFSSGPFAGLPAHQSSGRKIVARISGRRVLRRFGSCGVPERQPAVNQE